MPYSILTTRKDGEQEYLHPGISSDETAIFQSRDEAEGWAELVRGSDDFDSVEVVPAPKK